MRRGSRIFLACTGVLAAREGLAAHIQVNAPHKHLRRRRASAATFVPTSSGGATAPPNALPQLRGLFTGVTLRAPVAVRSLADLVFLTARRTSADEANRIFKEAAATDRYRGILGVTEDPIVSSHVIRTPAPRSWIWG